MDILNFNSIEWDKFSKSIEKLRTQAMPYAVKKYLDTLATDTQDIGRKNIQGRMILRNKYTLQSVKVNLAMKSRNIEAMKSAAGSTQRYMNTQEKGGMVAGDKGRDKPLATTTASGEGGSVRKRLPKRDYRLSKIRLSTRAVRANSKKQENYLKVMLAAKNGDKYVYLDTGRKKFIAKVTVTNLSAGRGRRGGPKFKGAKVRMLYDLSRKTVTVRPHPWLKPATDSAMKKRDIIWDKAIKYEMSRIWLLRGV